MDEPFIETLIRAKQQLIERQRSLVQELANGQFEHIWLLPQLRAGLRELDRLIQRERASTGFQSTRARAVELTGVLTDQSRRLASTVEVWIRERLRRRTGG